MALVLGLLVLGWFLFLRPVSLGGPAGYIFVSGQSMEPTLAQGDLVVVWRQETYAIGDVIAYRVQEGTVIHRIIGGSAMEGYVTKGDNNPGPDLWRPRPPDIIGRMVLHLRGAARVLAWWREPPQFAALASGLVAFSLLPRAASRGRRRNGQPPGRPESGPALASGLLGLTGFLAVVGGLLTVLAFRQPLIESVTVERFRYEQSGTFTYTVQVQPSALYPEGIAGPVTPLTVTPTPTPASRAGGDQPLTGPPIFTRQPRRFDLTFDYTLKTTVPAEIAGQVSALVEVRAGPQGWSRPLETVPPIAFSGPQVRLSVPVDLARTWAIIEAIEKETDYRPGVYEVRIIPTVRVSGRLGPEALDDVFAPVFTLRLSRTQIVPDGDLVRVQPRVITETEIRSASLRLPGIGASGLPVWLARLVGLGGTALATVIAGWLAARLFLGIGQDAPTWIRTRYGSHIVSVTATDLGGARTVRVATIADLVRVAERQGLVVLHQTQGPGEHRYFVPVDGLVYEYRWTAGVQAEESGERG